MPTILNKTEDTKNKPVLKKLNPVDAWFMKVNSIPLKEKLFFVQNLSVMVRAGVALSASINSLALQTENAKLKYILTDVGESVEKGQSFTDSLRKHEKDFGELFVNMIEAGELSGKLEDVLVQLHTQIKKQHELTAKIKSALTYPTVIMIAMLGIGAFMIVFIIPQITAMFKEMDAEIPLATRILMGVSDYVVNHGIIVSVSIFAFIFIFIKTIRTKKGKYYFQAFILKTPIIGPIVKKINLASFARNTSSLLKTDIMIVKTFQISANTLGNVHYKNVLFELSEKIQKGEPISKALAAHPDLFPLLVSQMVAVGEETGELDSILEEMADFYEGEVNQIMTSLPSIIEPILMLALGIGVGAMAIAIIMPMYSLSNAV